MVPVNGASTGLLPKSIWKDEFQESLIFFVGFPNKMGTHRARPSNELTHFDLGNRRQKCAPI